MPFAFVAVTVHVYDFPFANPLTEMGEAVPAAAPAAPPFDDTHAALYPVIALPPSNGATNDTVACALPADTVGAAGPSGTRFGIASGDGTDGAPSPLLFVAVTVHVYDFPLDKPLTTIGDAGPLAEPGLPPFDDTHAAEYPVIGLPPSNGATNDTVNFPLPTPAVGGPGSFGTVLGTTVADAGDAAPAPFALVAVTVQVYVFPFDNEPTRTGELSAEFVPVTPPLEDTHVASKRVIALPPLAGATNDTVTCPLPTATVGCAGALGIVLGTATADAGDAAPAPFAFVADTVHVYDFPFVRPLTTVGDAVSEVDAEAPPFDDTHATV